MDSTRFSDLVLSFSCLKFLHSRCGHRAVGVLAMFTSAQLIFSPGLQLDSVRIELVIGRQRDADRTGFHCNNYPVVTVIILADLNAIYLISLPHGWQTKGPELRNF